MRFLYTHLSVFPKLKGEETVMIVLGNAAADFLVSRDRGLTWTTVATPLQAGEATKGIFSVAFKNELEGIIVGGDYRCASLTYHSIFFPFSFSKAFS